MCERSMLFDLDGTLTDSGEGIIHCAQLALKEMNLPVPAKEEMRIIVGPPLHDSFIRFGVRPEDTDTAIAIYRKYYLDFGKYENFPYPGIENLLRRLKEDGHVLYVATSKPETMSVDILEHFGLAHYFDRICGATMDGSRGTKAAVIDYLLHTCPVQGNLLMVGDTIYDVLGAKELGIPSVGVSWGYGVVGDMEQAGALAIVCDTEQLYQFIRRYEEASDEAVSKRASAPAD